MATEPVTREELAEALREVIESEDVSYPPYDEGADAQEAWCARIFSAKNKARALLSRLDAEAEAEHEPQP